MDVGALFAAHHRSLVRYLYRLSGDADLADDAAQEAFFRLQQRPPAHGRELRAWLFTVGTRALLDQTRTDRRRRTIAHAHAPELVGSTRGPEQHLEAAESRRLVREALDALNEGERTALLMREEGFTHREIAESIGTTTKSVGTILARALTKLAKRLPLDEEA
ncbi:MAG: sigma-70 family RNA polymerase sigma factor [Gemmatimonadota bacterium]